MSRGPVYLRRLEHDIYILDNKIEAMKKVINIIKELEVKYSNDIYVAEALISLEKNCMNWLNFMMQGREKLMKKRAEILGGRNASQS